MIIDRLSTVARRLAGRLALAFMLLFGLALLVSPGSALAAPTLTLTPSSAPRGAQVMVTGSGYQPNAALQLLVEPAPGRRDRFTELTAAADGTIRYTFTVPPGVPPGTVTFVVVSAADMAELARALFTITDAPAVGPQVSVAPASGPVGTRFTVTGRGFQAGAELVYGIGPGTQPVVLGRITIGADGTFTSSFDSSSIPLGEHELAVNTFPLTRPLALTRFTVTAAATPGLPNTGAGGTASWLIPALLVATLAVTTLGVLVVGIGRRRRAA